MENIREFQVEQQYCIVCKNWDREKKKSGKRPCLISGRLKSAINTCAQFQEDTKQQQPQPTLPGIE